MLRSRPVHLLFSDIIWLSVNLMISASQLSWPSLAQWFVMQVRTGNQGVGRRQIVSLVTR